MGGVSNYLGEDSSSAIAHTVSHAVTHKQLTTTLLL